MRSMIFRSFLILTFTALTILAADNDLSGTWKVSGSVYGNAIEQACTIKQEESKLTGSCKTEGMADAVITGEINDKNVTWKFNSDYNGTEITLVYTGVLNEDKSNISGKINVAPFGVDGDFTARKEGSN
ncbi:MAG: hypothetical protein KDB79_11415 [Acidobacteria bacterium]|nr:hypothetical protein [Acidobacteriota bacterium]